MNDRLKKIKTDDGSESFLDPGIGEHYHSTGGAISEAKQKHAIPAEILKRYEENGEYMDILDFAFGLGYNSAAALDILLSNGYSKPNISITALENDPVIIEKITKIDPPLKGYDFFKEMARKAGEYSGFINPFIYADENISLHLYLEDALTRTAYLSDNKFDVIFFDPFSSGRMPQLWTIKVFKTLYKKLKNGGCLTTYSCAKHFRNKLVKCGFTWRDVAPGFERRGPSTVAFKP